MKTGDAIRNVARTVWRRFPRKVKGKVFEAFLWAVRKRRVVAEVDGLRFAFDLGERIDALVYLGAYERDVVRAIDVLLKPGWCVLDIGANIGAHTLRMSKCVGKEGRVIAFEPTSFAYKKLLKNLALNDSGNVIAIKAAASDRNSNNETIVVRSSWATFRPVELDTCSVPFWRLDDWLERNQIHSVNLIKIDVDGEECAVLRGAVDAVKDGSPVVLLEVGGYHFETSEKNPIALLRNFGYRFWDLAGLREYANEQSIRSRLPEHDPDKRFSLNVMAACDESAIRALLGGAP